MGHTWKRRGVVRARVGGQGSPEFASRPPLLLVQRMVPDALRADHPAGAMIQCYGLGECSVIVTVIEGVHHLSISHPGRYPNWDEIAEARYRCLGRVPYMALYLPPLGVYVNHHPNCFQVIEAAPSPYLAQQEARMKEMVRP